MVRWMWVLLLDRETRYVKAKASTTAMEFCELQTGLLQQKKLYAMTLFQFEKLSPPKNNQISTCILVVAANDNIPQLIVV
jgi:hypothetical protein